MANVYEGKPDGRQADTAIAVTRFRPAYRALTDEEKALHDEIKTKATELEGLFDQARDIGKQHDAVTADKARYHDLAVTELEVCVMWAVKALTS